MERIGIDIRIAKKDLLPSFIITGNIGFNFYNISSPHNFLADIGLVPVWDLFTGGLKIQRLKLQKDRYDIAIQHYEKVILKSIQETNDTLYELKTAGNITNIAEKRNSYDIKELLLTELKEDAGTADYLDYLMAKQQAVLSEKLIISSKINEIIAMINLYQALGGLDFTKPEVL